MSYTLYQVDAFTAAPFAGNPAAVCVLDDEPSADWMQDVAREMNLSETAYLQRRDGGFGLRWFTPACEVDLCGHATLASAHVLWEQGLVAPSETARFHTLSGELTAERGDDGWIRMNFPAEPVRSAPPPAGLVEALGQAAVVAVSRNRMDVLVELPTDDAVRRLTPALMRLAQIDARGIIVTAKAEPDAAVDFVSRFFAPQSGVPEDPVTGSAHCALGPYWADKLGRSTLVGRQVSARGGTVRVEVAGDRVFLSGQAVTVLEATLRSF